MRTLRQLKLYKLILGYMALILSYMVLPADWTSLREVLSPIALGLFGLICLVTVLKLDGDC